MHRTSAEVGRDGFAEIAKGKPGLFEPDTDERDKLAVQRIAGIPEGIDRQVRAGPA